MEWRRLADVAAILPRGCDSLRPFPVLVPYEPRWVVPGGEPPAVPCLVRPHRRDLPRPVRQRRGRRYCCEHRARHRRRHPRPGAARSPQLRRRSGRPLRRQGGALEESRPRQELPRLRWTRPPRARRPPRRHDRCRGGRAPSRVDRGE